MCFLFDVVHPSDHRYRYKRACFISRRIVHDINGSKISHKEHQVVDICSSDRSVVSFISEDETRSAIRAQRNVSRRRSDVPQRCGPETAGRYTREMNAIRVLSRETHMNRCLIHTYLGDPRSHKRCVISGDPTIRFTVAYRMRNNIVWVINCTLHTAT